MLTLYPQQQFFTTGGLPLAGGKIYTYSAGTSTPKSVYSDSTGATALSNPVILDANGMAAFWLSGSYKVVLQDANGVQIWSNDNVSYSPYQSAATGVSEWLLQTLTALTYISATQFSCTSDQTPTFQVKRRIQATVSAGTIYGTITASSFSLGVTTVTVSWDTGSLDSGLSAVYVGILSTTNESLPADIATQSGTRNYATDTGVADAYVVTFAPVPGAWAAGFRFYTQITHANATTTPTVTPNSFGAKTIVRPDGSAVNIGDLPLNWMAQFEYYDATHAALLNPALPKAATITGTMMALGKVVNIQYLTSGTSYTPTTGTKDIISELLGGGGGGGGGNAANGFASGGGAGGFARKVFRGIGAGPYTCTVGGPGAGGTGANGGVGGNTSLTIGATTVTANGGAGGSLLNTGVAGGLGGSTTNGDLNCNGSPGGAGASTGQGGLGASSQYGAGGLSGNGANGGNGLGYGSGGGGGASGVTQTGGNGASGIIIVYEYA